MTTSRTTRGGRHAAGVAPRTARLPILRTRGRRLLAGGLAAATATGGLVGLAGAAQAGNPPLGPGNIEVFVKRDMVALEGYTEQAGQTATITVKRGGQVIGSTEGVVDPTGFLEVNHPGGVCWGGATGDEHPDVTPNIRGTDLVEVTFSGSALRDGAHVGTAEIRSVTSGHTPTPDDPADQEYTVTIAGTYGQYVDPSRFVVEIINPAMREPGSTIGDRALGWAADPAAENGTANPDLSPVDPREPEFVGYTATGEFGAGSFSATFAVSTEADQQLLLEGEHVALSWLADGANDLALGATQYENGEIDGPGFGGCPPGAGAQGPTGPDQAVLTTTAGTDTVTVDWEPAAQPADAPDVTAYRVSASDTGAGNGQEVALRTDGATTVATLEGFRTDPATPVDVYLETYNGQWSAPVKVGTATPGTASSTGGGDTGGGDTGGDTGGGTGGDTGGGTGGEPAPLPAPAGLTTTATALDAADVTWTATTGAVGYEVTASSTTAGAAVPAAVAVTAPATTASLTGLTPGAGYTVSVTASDGTRTSTAATSELTLPTQKAPGAATLTRVVATHEQVTAEWTAAAAADRFSPVTGYDVVADPNTAVPGDEVTASVDGAALRGTVTGLRNGTAYTVTVTARSGTAVGPTATAGQGVTSQVTPNDVVTVGRAEYRATGEWRIRGTAVDATANTVKVYVVTGTGRTQVGAAAGVAVAADGTWALDVRNGPVPPAGTITIQVESSSGGKLTHPGVTRR